VLRFVPLVAKQVFRQRTRTVLTLLGVASAMFLYAAVRSLQSGVEEATGERAGDNLLVVYRQNRFCPFTSRLPERYEARIRELPDVASVTPMKIVVSNCRASLDVVTFRGVRKTDFARDEGPGLVLVSGSLDDWLRRTDAALVGRTLADRRGFRAGDRFDANGVTVTVAAVFDSREPQDRNVAYVDLEFLQRAPGVSQLGTVTQFNVRVTEPARLQAVAEAVDALFATDQEPTSTRSEKDFVARTAGDVMELLGFTRWVALGCLGAVLALVTNTVVMSVHDRVRDYAVFQTVGFTGALLARLVVLEGLVLGLVGGAAGTLAATLALRFTHFSLSNEGLSIAFVEGPEVWLHGLLVSALVGVAAGLVPALRATRLPIAAAFRAV
jgi:putative ABC transport system permease protein